jgi:hypothetical protein
MFLWLRILMNASHFDFIFWWRFHFSSEKWRFRTWLRILTKLSWTSYFDEGFTLWLRISMNVSLFLWEMKASHLISYFDESFLALYFNEGFTLWLCISTKVSLFFIFFSEKWSLHTWLYIFTKVSLTSYFDECFLL